METTMEMEPNQNGTGLDKSMKEDSIEFHDGTLNSTGSDIICNIPECDNSLLSGDEKMQCNQTQQPNQKQQNEQYQSRKPKWWTKLSGRRGTRAQRQAMQRMTQRGYCISKEVLTEFTRESNRAMNKNDFGEVTEGGDKFDDWRRAWWNRALGISEDGVGVDVKKTFSSHIRGTSPDNIITTSDINLSNQNATKYTYETSNTQTYENPLPSRKYLQKWLEIGFGNGENLLANSRKNPNILFMGSEIHSPGMGGVLRKIEIEIEKENSRKELAGGRDSDENHAQPQNESACKRELDSDEGSKSNSPDGMTECENDVDSSPHNAKPQNQSWDELNSLYQNIRILPGDGVKLLSHLPENYLDAILVTFPDPWPRECHVRWRVIQKEVVREMQRVLKSRTSDKNGNNEVEIEGPDDSSTINCSNHSRVFVATDAECFDSWSRKIFCQEPSTKSVEDNSRNAKDEAKVWEEVVPCPDRSGWLPVVSYYEQKGLDEGRSTMLQCWNLCD